jgi:CO/xanthine dehydrogenase FAD-binding subunit
MIDFEYYAPGSLKEALMLLHKSKGEAKILAGGTDLVVQMKNESVRPAVVVDIKNITELNKLEWNDKVLRIGAALPLSRIINFPPLKQFFHVLYQACASIGSVQLRNRATLGGNICNAAPSADSAPALLCLEALAIVLGTKAKRRIRFEEFFSGPGQTALAKDEILLGVEIPAPASLSLGYYLKHTPRQDMDIAIAGVCSWLSFNPISRRCQEARIALGAVAPTPIRVTAAEALLRGKEISADNIELAAQAAAQTAQPISDVRGSAEYRREMVRVLTRRSLQKAMGTDKK